MFYAFSKWAVASCSRFLFRVRAYGLANLPKQGGALLLSNHQSFLDPPLVGASSTRRLSYMARDTLFRNPLFGALLRAVGVFPVKRGRPDKDSIRLAIERLVSGHLLLMFPEGTRTPDGRLQSFKGGFRFLVGKANVPVVPVAIDGTYEAWPRSRRLPRPGRVRVMFAPGIPPEEFEGLSDEEAADRVAGEIAALLEKLRRLP